MCASWKKDFELSLVFTRLEADKKVEDGKARFTGHSFEDCMAILNGSVNFASEIPEDTARDIVNQSVFAAARDGSLSSKSVIREISIREAEYKSLPVNAFIMAVSISIRSKTQLSEIKSSYCTIRFGQKVPKVIRNKERMYPEIFYQAVHREIPHDYMRAAVTTHGRSISEAGGRALDSLDLYRAMWNLRLNRQRGWRMSIGPVNPVNTVMLGPLQTLFKADGSLIEDHWWYERPHYVPVRVEDVTATWTELRSFERKILARLRATNLREFLERGLRRYVRALDGRDYEPVFLKLWSLLEYLTISSRDSYDVTIRRAAFLCKDHRFHRQLLNYLRDSRNASAHLDVFGDHGEMLVYQLKRYVEVLLEFLIFNGLGFKTKDDIKHFLDLDPNRESLIERKRLVNRGIEFLS